MVEDTNVYVEVGLGGDDFLDRLGLLVRDLCEDAQHLQGTDDSWLENAYYELGSYFYNAAQEVGAEPELTLLRSQVLHQAV